MSKRKEKLRSFWLYSCSLIFTRPFKIGTIFVTRKCNKNCSYCFTGTNKIKEEFELEEIKRIIDRFKELGVWYLAVYGGEPTLRIDLAEIIKYARSKNMFIVLHTNGSFEKVNIDEVMEAGVSIVDIAIDSISNPDLKNYKKVEKIIKKLMVERKIGIKFNFCITKQNYQEIEAILEKVNQLQIPISIHLGSHPVLAVDDNFSNSCFRKGNSNDIKIVEGVSELLAKEARTNSLLMHPPEYFEAWPGFLKGEKQKWICRAGKDSLCINSDGTVLQCVGANYPIRINNKSLHWNDVDNLNFKDIKQETQDLVQQCNPDCLSCVYMLQYYFTRNPWRFLKILLNF